MTAPPRPVVRLRARVQDELFPETAPAPAAAIRGRITCAVCLRPGVEVPVDHPAKLCTTCLGDLDAARAHVAIVTADTLAQLDQNRATWEATLARSPAAARWEKVQAALNAVAERTMAESELARVWAKRKAEGGPLARLLVDYEAYAAMCDRLQARLGELGRAQEEINTAWLAMEGV